MKLQWPISRGFWVCDYWSKGNVCPGVSVSGSFAVADIRFNRSQAERKAAEYIQDHECEGDYCYRVYRWPWWRRLRLPIITEGVAK